MLKIYRKLKNRKLIAPGRGKYFLLAAMTVCAGAIPQNILAASVPAYAAEVFQGVTVKGKVTDDTKSSLPGVSVVEKGTTNGTVTDSNGDYSLVVSSAESVLVFTFVGMTTHQVIVGTQSEISFEMIPDAETLSEVVVVGYGTQEKKDITGAVGSVKSEDFNKGIINAPEQLLQGKMAGVNVTSANGEPGGALAITIRGAGTVRSGNTPLFVVDGFPLDNSSTGGTTNPLSFLNPQDIESIDVLKDASAAAVYGARGANGVVIITTKRGKAGRTAVNYSAGFGFSKLARAIDVFDANEFREQVVASGGVLEDSLANTNWQDEITRTALTVNHNLSISGGVDKLTYYASFGLQDQEGIIKNSDLKRYNGRFNLNQKFLEDRLMLDVNLTASQVVNNRPPSEGNNGASISILGTALTANPTYPTHDANGNPVVYQTGNPLRALDLAKDITTTNRIMGNISPSFEIIKGLVYKLNFGIDNSTSVRDIVSMPSVAPQQDGRFEAIYTTNVNRVIEHYLTYSMEKNDHDLSVMAGYSYQRYFNQQRSFSINKFQISELDPRNTPFLGQDLTLANNKPGGFTKQDELQSFFARATYQFKERYLLTGTYRVDGSTKFGENYQYGSFPSFSLGWRISEEPFMQNIPVSTLKLRAGWGVLGNQEIEGKLTKAFFSAGVTAGNTYPIASGAYPAGITYARLANPNLKWEEVTQMNIGLDFGFLDGALTGSIDYFKRETTDLLIRIYPSDPIQPSQTMFANVPGMTINNNGLELALNYQLNVNDITANFGGNITFIDNKVQGSQYQVIPSGSVSGSGLTSATVNGYINGEPIGSFFLREFVGIDENGMNVYKDQDGDGAVTDKDRIVAGSALPDKTYNFFASAAYKGFDLSINFNGVAGNKVYDNTANANFYKIKISKNSNTTPDATEFSNESINNPALISTRYLKDGSFLRLNNVSLGYNFAPKMIGMDRWINSLRLSVTGQNLFVKTNYNGYDPEVNTDRQVDGNLSYGVDYLSYPKAKTVVFGLNVGF